MGMGQTLSFGRGTGECPAAMGVCRGAGAAGSEKESGGWRRKWVQPRQQPPTATEGGTLFLCLAQAQGQGRRRVAAFSCGCVGCGYGVVRRTVGHLSVFLVSVQGVSVCVSVLLLGSVMLWPLGRLIQSS
jgi:hypothetical protein